VSDIANNSWPRAQTQTQASTIKPGLLLPTLTLIASLLPSTFVGGGSIALLGGVFSALWALRNRRVGELTWITAAWGLAIVFTAISGQGDLPLIEVMKAGIGMGLFFTALVCAPGQIAVLRATKAPILETIALVSSLAFFLEFFHILSMKDLGLVGWFETAAFKARFDLRPSGLYSEPSWLALSLSALNFAMIDRRHKWTPVALITSIVSCVLCGSSIGLLLNGLLVSWILFTRPLPGLPKDRAILARFALVCLAICVAFALAGVMAPAQFDKIIHPTRYGSGVARFVAPLYYLSQAVGERPIFGLGLSYMTERLFGLTGMAILPLNVTIETGILGLLLYSLYLTKITVQSHPRLLGLLAAFICLISLGMQYSPYQAMLLALFVSFQDLEKSQA